ncbi:hypothetical protein K505DRAFT_86926 [Melanomma pulvis-pyrius CBS 109.77]|uniref:Uncharacterized protein n=1 Tax=Melanomma pulvis-pyrius CBS 109.77 TaxID=1314802 RepID=A0A6A6X0M8_9PLEO|nr:hypothetical protein K505DRAFT_86926 [Melanomma pulvis-pyrius CBS 109.77]
MVGRPTGGHRRPPVLGALMPPLRAKHRRRLGRSAGLLVGVGRYRHLPAEDRMAVVPCCLPSASYETSVVGAVDARTANEQAQCDARQAPSESPRVADLASPHLGTPTSQHPAASHTPKALRFLAVLASKPPFPSPQLRILSLRVALRTVPLFH